MATKRTSSAKKGSKKAKAKKATKAVAARPPINFNFQCLERCAEAYGACLTSGVDPKKCMNRLIRCIRGCVGGFAAGAKKK